MELTKEERWHLQATGVTVKSLGERLYDWRKKNDLSQSEAA